MTMQTQTAERPSARPAPPPLNVAVDCGWGRLLFGPTFADAATLAATLEAEADGRRDVAFYVDDPQVLLAAAPQALFLDPSYAYRLDLGRPQPRRPAAEGIAVRPARPDDEAAVNRLYKIWSMVPVAAGYLGRLADNPAVACLVACDGDAAGDVLGVVMGVDHFAAFADAEAGTSLWALAVDPQARRPGIGEALTLALAERYRALGRAFMDLSVMHDNADALALYDKLGFRRLATFAVKKKNPINEKLFVGPAPKAELNIYARIIVDEARRRGIQVDVEDAEAGLFRLTHGGRAVSCRESLSELTTAVAMSRCDDKRLTHRLLERAGLNVPAQFTVRSAADLDAVHGRFERYVVKPARGEQGQGVAVDLATRDELEQAFERARRHCDDVIVEECVAGDDLRIVVIGDDIAAAAIRRPPVVEGDGRHTVAELIEKLSRRRAAATGGESTIPLDDETRRCLAAAGHDPDDVLAEGLRLAVRKTANLHTGGSIHDVTGELHPALARAALAAARALDIPVVGLDFMVADPAAPDYAIIEANERPGLANHEPQPTAERFIDLLFPQTVAAET